jgi:hypothetical protein
MTGCIDTFLYNLPFILITTNYTNSNQSSAEPFFLDCQGLAPFSFSFYDWLLIYGIHIWVKYHILCCCEGIITAPLPSNRSPTVPRVCFCGNVFSDPMPSNRQGADHTENTNWNSFSIVACAYFGRCLEMGLHVTVLIVGVTGAGFSSSDFCFILPVFSQLFHRHYHSSLRCWTALTRQHIITFSVFKFGGLISDVALGWFQIKELG